MLTKQDHKLLHELVDSLLKMNSKEKMTDFLYGVLTEKEIKEISRR